MGLGEGETDLLGGEQRPLILADMAHGQEGSPAAAGFHDRALEKTLGRIRRHQGQDRAAACAFAKQGHLVRIAAKGRNIGLYPFQRRDLVHHSIIGARLASRLGFRAEGGMGEIGETAESIVEADKDNPRLGEL